MSPVICNLLSKCVHASPALPVQTICMLMCRHCTNSLYGSTSVSILKLPRWQKVQERFCDQTSKTCFVVLVPVNVSTCSWDGDDDSCVTTLLQAHTHDLLQITLSWSFTRMKQSPLWSIHKAKLKLTKADHQQLQAGHAYGKQNTAALNASSVVWSFCKSCLGFWIIYYNLVTNELLLPQSSYKTRLLHLACDWWRYIT